MTVSPGGLIGAAWIVSLVGPLVLLARLLAAPGGATLAGLSSRRVRLVAGAFRRAADCVWRADQ